ncbi:MAG: DUF2029 domain-containing protein [Planctomycetales bacterium]|nr:DUF2029 domain-containing protein [Planctomycetales bacterium]
MNEFPLGYERVPPTTWAYLSSLLLLAVYFKFSRFWSVRNLDLFLIILLAPGLLFVHFGAAGRERIRTEVVSVLDSFEAQQLNDEAAASAASPSESTSGNEVEPSDSVTSDASSEVAEAGAMLRNSFDSTPPSTEAVDPRFDVVREEYLDAYFKARRLEHRGYLWLFLVNSLLLIRMLVDPMLVRRPLLEPNLSSGGLTFMGSSMLVFMLANLFMTAPMKYDLYYVPEISERIAWPEAEVEPPQPAEGPGYRLLSNAPMLPMLVDTTRRPVDTEDGQVSTAPAVMARLLVIASLAALVVAIVLCGSRHFENYWMGIGIATLFLMLPYSVQMTGRINHVLPAALLVWAVFVYRLPFLAGMFIGAASGLIYYPLFLLPLWLSFYWRRGWVRFALGVSTSLLSLLVSLWLFGDGQATFTAGMRQMFGLWMPRNAGLGGIWALGWEPVFRLPMIAGVVAIAGSLAIWPSRKNLGTLISGSCAILIGVQFWDGYQGGLSMGWYLPLALLAIFRPNTDDKTADRVIRSKAKAPANGAGTAA